MGAWQGLRWKAGQTGEREPGEAAGSIRMFPLSRVSLSRGRLHLDDGSYLGVQGVSREKYHPHTWTEMEPHLSGPTPVWMGCQRPKPRTQDDASASKSPRFPGFDETGSGRIRGVRRCSVSLIGFPVGLWSCRGTYLTWERCITAPMQAAAGSGPGQG